MGDREQFWQTHVDACRVSGVSQKTYCERHGITPKTFRKWRARLAGATPVVTSDGEPHGGEAKGGAREFFSPSFDDLSDRAQLVDLLTNPRFRRTWTPEQRQQIVIDALRSGMSIERFARMSGLTPSVVYRWREELATRVRHGPPPQAPRTPPPRGGPPTVCYRAPGRPPPPAPARPAPRAGAGPPRRRLHPCTWRPRLPSRRRAWHSTPWMRRPATRSR